MPPWVSSDPHRASVKPKAVTPQLQVKVPDITKRVRSESVPRGVQYSRQSLDREIVAHDDPRNQMDKRSMTGKTEVIKILSTAGTGIHRENELQEARGNIGRFITVDKVRRDDSERVANAAKRKVSAPTPIQHNKKQYDLIKEEQIKGVMERENFQNYSKNRIPKPPQPFRGSTQDLSHVPTESFESSKHSAKPNNNVNDTKPKKTEEIQLNTQQKIQLIHNLLQQVPIDFKRDLLTKLIMSSSAEDLSSILGKTSDEVVNIIVPVLFPRTSDDVKQKLVLGCLPDFAQQMKSQTFPDTESERFNKRDSIQESPNPDKEKDEKRNIEDIKSTSQESLDPVDGNPRELEEKDACIITNPLIKYDLVDSSNEEDDSEEIENDNNRLVMTEL